MTEGESLDELELTDRELIQLIKSHGIDRRPLLKALGAGTVLSLGAGNAAAKHDDPHPSHIDSHYGYSAPADETLPGKLRPDHEVGLRIREEAIVDRDPTTVPFHFEPMGLKVDEGDIVRFNFETPDHTVTAYHAGHGRQQRVPDGKPAFSSPLINAGGFWLYEFDVPGTYDIYCAPHELFGMVMRIVVGDPDSADYDTINTPPQGRPPVSRDALSGLGIDPWPFPTPAELLDTAALAVSNIVSSGSVSVSDVEDEFC